MQRVLGIDPGSRITGFGVIQVEANAIRYVASGVIKTSEATLSGKLAQIFDGVRQVITCYEPTEAAIEEVFMHQNAQSALKLGQARGAAMVAMSASPNEFNVAEYTARQIKQAVVGYGNADKQQVQHMVKQLLSLSSAPSTDAADGLAVAICHIQAKAGQLGDLRATGYRRGRIKT